MSETNSRFFYHKIVNVFDRATTLRSNTDGKSQSDHLTLDDFYLLKTNRKKFKKKRKTKEKNQTENTISFLRAVFLALIAYLIIQHAQDNKSVFQILNSV